MARIKEFDPDTVLRRAMDLFWAQGYEATSMSELVDHLGIARASLYATFGGKRDLYVAALDLYAKERAALFVQQLSAPGPVLPAIRSVVHGWVTEARVDAEHRGCFVVNAAIEHSVRDPQIAHMLEVGWSVQASVLTSAFVRAQAQGELDADADPAAMADLLLVLLQGIRVLARASERSDRLDAAVDQALAIIG